ncbi:MAG: nitroreductase [Rhodospirillaceae bacterium]|nr:nitroreductase [Rhodospirillaceae bacterium]|tara:strand:+ start:1187 stop:1879 length:693 start_codon:yes stop_codon:yes gene_type:complete
MNDNTELFEINNIVSKIVSERSSKRSFLPDEVSIDLVRDIIEKASRAPSGTNTQPWKVTCVTGKTKSKLTRAVLNAAAEGEAKVEYEYMPSTLREPYISRKRAVGYALFELYGIKRDDYPARKAAMLRNFEFFGAPVGLFFRMDRDLLHGSWLDVGMFMQNVMILARGKGLETCPQQAWCNFGSVVHEVLNIPNDEIIISGMSLGYAKEAPENTLVSDRADINEFTTFLQ